MTGPVTGAVTGGGPTGAWPGPIAEDLLRVVRQDLQGSLPRHGLRERAGAARRLDVTLRAALFCDLARAGLVVAARGPVAADPARPGGGSGRNPADEILADWVLADRILAAVLAAVDQRPGLAWTRWFRHVREDRTALVGRLVESGRWTAQGGNRFLDADPGGAQRLQARAFTVSELIAAPADDRETVLGYLYALTGPRMPAERALGWDVRLAGLDRTAPGSSVRAVLAAAALASAGSRRGRPRRR